MSNFLIKLRLVYLQFLLVAVGFIAIYSAFTWLLIYQFPVLDLNETITKFGLPFCLPVIPVYIWLWPRIKIMPLKTKRDNGQFGYFFIACLAIGVPTIILQEYLQVASGKLTTIDNISQIHQKPVTKYYKIENHFIDKQRVGVYRRAEVSGRNSEHLTFYIYIVCPILANAPLKNDDVYIRAWLGILYSKSISNNSNDTEKQQAFADLGTEANTDFKTHDFDRFVYLDRIGNNDNRKGYYAAVRSIPQLSNMTPLVLEARNEPFEARMGGKLGWVFKSFGIGAAVWLILLTFPKIDKKQIEKLPQYSVGNQWRGFINFITTIKIGRSSQIFIILIAINVLVFVVMFCSGLGFISFDGEDLYKWGANFRPAVVDGQWWRLLTNIFLHGGVMHLFFNMYGLFFAAIFLEPILRKWRFVIAYLLCGLIASLTSILWHPETLSVGASGAIFGLYGVLLILVLFNKAGSDSKKFLLINTGIFIVLNLVMGIRGGIDNAAHIGGLLAGVLLGCVLCFFIEAPKPKRRYKKRIKVATETESTPEHLSP
jgi:rhomboid protease GluP